MQQNVTDGRHHQHKQNGDKNLSLGPWYLQIHADPKQFRTAPQKRPRKSFQTTKKINRIYLGNNLISVWRPSLRFMSLLVITVWFTTMHIKGQHRGPPTNEVGKK